MADPLHVPRRRVPVQLRLQDGRSLVGEAYLALRRADGSQERLLDRLNDVAERYLPIAIADRHLLVRKAAVVSARLVDPVEAAAARDDHASGLVPVEVALSVGPAETGDLRAGTEQAHDRALDKLNRVVSDFVALLDGDTITFVNTHHVVAVLERPTARRPFRRAGATAEGADARSPGIRIPPDPLDLPAGWAEREEPT